MFSEKENRTILWAEEVVAYLKMGRGESESEEGTEEAKARRLNLGQEGDGGQNPGRRGWEPRLGCHHIGPRSLTNGLRLRLACCPQAFRPTSLLIGLPRRGASGQLFHKKGCCFSALHRVPWTPAGASALPSGWCLRKSQGLRRPSIQAGTEGVNASWPVYDPEPEASWPDPGVQCREV